MHLVVLLLVALTATPLAAQDYRRGEIVERLATSADPEITYAYYLPAAYTPERKWPVLFVFDPRQRGAFAAELFRDAAETYGWILVSSNDTRTDTGFDRNVRAVNAMWSDVSRFAIDRDRIYATGFSGGAVLAWVLAVTTKQVAGIIAVGGRVPDAAGIKAVPFDWFGTAGDSDFNHIEMAAVEERLAAAGSARRLEIFAGGHRWAPPEVLRTAIEWMEVMAMRRGSRTRDQAMLDLLLAKDLSAAASSPDELTALRRYESILRTFDGLVALDDARLAVGRLRKSPNVVRLLSDERAALKLETAHRRRMPGIFRSRILDSEAIPVVPTLAHELQIQRLLDLAKRKTLEGAAAQRVLETIYVNLAYYIGGQVSGARLAAVQEVARMIHPEAK